MSNLFWEDLARDLEDPEFLREYVTHSVRIATVDTIINALDEARIAEGLSKAELARAIGSEPAVVRRLFAAGNVSPNPTLGTLVDVAAALGLRITVQPMPATEQATITKPLRTGQPSKDTTAQVAKMRRVGRRGSAAAAPA